MNNEGVTGRPPSDEPAETPRLGLVVAGLSRRLHAQTIGAGALAELRRITDDDMPPAFWRRYLTDVPAEWREPGGHVDARIDRAWAGIIRAMVEMAPNPHAFERPFGTMLADTGYSEHRFVRLLRAEGQDLAREVRIAAAWLARAGAGAANWEQPAHLLLGRPWLGLHVVRHTIISRRIARDYFRAAAQQAPSQ
jgi:hypothetical protein